MDGTLEDGKPVLVTGPLTELERPGELAIEPDCPKCTGPMLRCQVGYVGIYGWWLERVTHPAGALGPARTVTSDVSARVCTRCGYTELYANEPGALAPRDELH